MRIKGNDPSLNEQDPSRMADILVKATSLFVQRGFEVLVMNDFAEQAGCTRRTLYRYFPSKDELFWRCFGRAVGLLTERQRLTARVYDSARLSVKDCLAAWTGAYLDFAVELPAEFRLVMEGRQRAAALGPGGLPLSPESVAWLQAFQRGVWDGVLLLGKRLEDQGECEPGAGAGRVGEFLVVLLGLIEFHARYREGGRPLSSKEAAPIRRLIDELILSFRFGSYSADLAKKEQP
jgi:AcrR family transcriptional regulator